MTDTQLPKRSLGKSGMDITVVGIGSWAMGGGGWAFSWGPQDDRASEYAIRHALDAGINWIDTAAVYGLGHSEEVVGRTVRAIPEPDRPYIFTKCGLNWNSSNRMLPPLRDLRPERIREECDNSLRRLGVERIDLYQFHWPDETGTPVEDSWEVMVELIEQGKVRAGGVSNFDVGLLERCEAIHHVDSLQPPFSLIERSVGGSQIPWCRDHSTGVICYSPMQSGLLTDSFSRQRVAAMAEDDWRRRDRNFTEPGLSANLALRDALVPLARKHETTVAAIAIAWVLAWPGVTGAIVGARSPEQVDGWLPGGTVTLDIEDLDAIGEAITRTGAGRGPLSPERK